MNYAEFTQISQKTATLVEQGKYKEAVTTLEALLLSDISDLDKAMQCLNIAVVYEKQGEIDKALKWYDRGILYETPYSRFYGTEQKAFYLAQKGRTAESIQIYEELLRKPFLMEGDKERVRKNVQQLRNR